MKTVLTNARLIDGTGRAAVDGATVVIDGDSVAEVSSGSASATGRVIDLGGRTLMPGLFDLHMHLNGTYKAVRLLRDALLAGVTTVAHVGGFRSGAEVVLLRDAIRSGDVVGVSRLVAGAVVAATAGHVHGRTADGPWEVRKAVREQVLANVDFIKTASTGGFWAEHEECWWTDYSREELDHLVDEAHSVGKQVVCHAHTQPGLNNAIEAGCDQIHHGAFIDEDALERIAAKDLAFVPTLRVTSDRNIDIKAAAGRPWESRKMREAHDLHRAGVRQAHQMGIRLGCGTDLPSTPPWRSGDTAFELWELTQCGLSPLEAIHVATGGSAQVMGLADRLGTIEPGQAADLLVIDGDPLADITILQQRDKVVLVILDGRIEKDLR